MLNESIDRFEQSEELVELSIFYGLLADRYLLHDDLDNANHWVDKGIGLVDDFGECFVEAPLLRLKAQCLLSDHPESSPQIDELVQHSNQVAMRQEATAWQHPGELDPLMSSVAGNSTQDGKKALAGTSGSFP